MKARKFPGNAFAKIARNITFSKLRSITQYFATTATGKTENSKKNTSPMEIKHTLKGTQQLIRHLCKLNNKYLNMVSAGIADSKVMTSQPKSAINAISSHIKV